MPFSDIDYTPKVHWLHTPSPEYKCCGKPPILRICLIPSERKYKCYCPTYVRYECANKCGTVGGKGVTELQARELWP